MKNLLLYVCVASLGTVGGCGSASACEGMSAGNDPHIPAKSKAYRRLDRAPVAKQQLQRAPVPPTPADKKVDMPKDTPLATDPQPQLTLAQRKRFLEERLAHLPVQIEPTGKQRAW